MANSSGTRIPCYSCKDLDQVMLAQQNGNFHDSPVSGTENTASKRFTPGKKTMDQSKGISSYQMISEKDILIGAFSRALPLIRRFCAHIV